MTERPILVPGPDHPITVQLDDSSVTATIDGQQIATSNSTLVLAEAGYPPVRYFPRADVQMSALERTDHTTYCPYKGDAAYFSIRTPEGTLDNVVRTYEQLHDAVATIADHVAFYTDRVDASVGPSN